jgi:mevalonate kinase
MDEKLEELIQYIRKTIPQPKAILHLTKDPKAGIVTFTWHARKFIVKPTLEVMELRGTKLYVTGSSMLMHAAFTKSDKNEKVLSALDGTLKEVEEFVAHHQVEKAMELLAVAKKTLEKLAVSHWTPRRKKDKGKS